LRLHKNDGWAFDQFDLETEGQVHLQAWQAPTDS